MIDFNMKKWKISKKNRPNFRATLPCMYSFLLSWRFCQYHHPNRRFRHDCDALPRPPYHQNLHRMQNLRLSCWPEFCLSSIWTAIFNNLSTILKLFSIFSIFFYVMLAVPHHQIRELLHRWCFLVPVHLGYRRMNLL